MLPEGLYRGASDCGLVGWGVTEKYQQLTGGKRMGYVVIRFSFYLEDEYDTCHELGGGIIRG
jgi:hypothetical protein